MLWAPNRRTPLVIARRILARGLGGSGIERYPRPMSGYVASARLEGGSLTFVAAAGRGSRRTGGRGGDPTPAPEDVEGRDWVELVGRPFGDRVAARLADLREAWSQTTFFLFDPESWR
jgi:hypothetical protein